jgi:diacylglycerol kinase (ATP)
MSSKLKISQTGKGIPLIMPRYFIVANPASGRGTGARMIPVIERLMEIDHLDYSLKRTERPWHAAELACQAAGEGYDTIVAAGGDGTVNEVINGMMQAQAAGPARPSLGVLTVGRGNDFAYSMNLPHNLEEDVHALAAGRIRSIDIGKLTGGLFPQGRYFGNGVGIGFDAVVGFESVKLAPLSGFASYLVGALKTMMFYFHAPLVQIELDNETLSQPALMVSIMNGRRMGGGFYMTPDSLTNDGLFDLCIAGSVSRIEILKLMMRFMKGTQAGHPEIKFRRSRRVVVSTLNGSLPAHADGETMAVKGQRLELEVIPGAINLVAMPQGESK